MELKIQADLSIAHRCASGWNFLKEGFKRALQIDQVNIRAGFGVVLGYGLRQI
jgi:hypothetical protein